jgi:putative intracellular protease/amidase
LLLPVTINWAIQEKKLDFGQKNLAAPYYELLDQGVEITIASPLGGQPPIDPKSADPASATEDTKRFDADKVLQEKLKHTLETFDINQKDYDAVFYPGGHGPLVGFSRRSKLD